MESTAKEHIVTTIPTTASGLSDFLVSTERFSSARAYGHVRFPRNFHQQNTAPCPFSSFVKGAKICEPASRTWIREPNPFQLRQSHSDREHHCRGAKPRKDRDQSIESDTERPVRQCTAAVDCKSKDDAGEEYSAGKEAQKLP